MSTQHLQTAPAWGLKARYIFPVDRPPLASATLTICGERIAVVGESAADTPFCDLGQVALIPGLINAHAHLEFSELSQPLTRPGCPLTDWIRCVIKWRVAQATHPCRGVSRGWDECKAEGTTTVAEIATVDSTCYTSAPETMDLLVMIEQIAPLASQRMSALAQLKGRLATLPARNHLRAGISPHAPYTVHMETLAELCRLSADRHLPLAMHLAESREEIEFLATGQGPLRELLVERHVDDDLTFGTARDPLDYLRQLRHAHRALVVHGNYLKANQLAYLAEHADHMGLVYCPRTHAFFGHSAYPLAQAISLGVCVALGTDGRASNPDLSLLREVRFVAQHVQQVAPQTALRLGTLGGAQALGREHELGSLTPGKLANLVAVTLPDHVPADPYEALLGESGGHVCGVWYRGRRLPLA